MKFFATTISLLTAVSMAAAQDGNTYISYENIRYVDNPVDSISQCLNIFVPDNAKADAPILLKTYTTDFRSTAPQQPSPADETILALQNGIVVCIVGTRGYNSMCISKYEIENPKKKKKKKKQPTVETDVEYCGKLPAPLLDLKAAVRYLRANDSTIAGSSEKIIATGYMAGGGLAVLLGSTANNPIYDDALKQMGAADVSDKILGVACFAPLTNPLDAATSGEWLMEGKGDYPNLLKSLTLLVPETEAPLNGSTYRHYLKNTVYDSAREAMEHGVQISDEMGPEYYSDSCDPDDIAEYMVDLNLSKYLNIIRQSAYKNGYRQYFTTLATKTFVEKTSKDYALNINQMSIYDKISLQNNSLPDKWYIRHGALDTAVPITETLTLAAMLSNLAIDVDFDVPWDVKNYNEYNAAKLIEWIKGL